MKTLYFDCSMGAAGDMLCASLLELFDEKEKMTDRLNALSIPGVSFSQSTVKKCGISGTHITVTVNGEEESEQKHDHDHDHDHKHDHAHHHSSLHDIEHIVHRLDVPQAVKKDVMAVYGIIADAESHVHGVPVTEIHFHEVGTMDAVADITAFCFLLNELGPVQIIVSPVHVGSGTVRCAHGVLPVPAPAAAYILKDVPIYGGEIKGELCTPTGAALLKYFSSCFSAMPAMKTYKIGYGMGSKDFEAANCVRAFLGETEDKKETVTELSFNVDDMTAEEIGFACERLFEGGALEVFTVPAGMKKTRPGTLIKVLCRMSDKEKIVGIIFKYTSTIGVRETEIKRYVLERNEKVKKTPYGDIRYKISSGYGVSRMKYEYEDIASAAKRQGISFDEAKKLVDMY